MTEWARKRQPPREGDRTPWPAPQGISRRLSLRLTELWERTGVPPFAGPPTAWPGWYLSDLDRIRYAQAYARHERDDLEAAPLAAMERRLEGAIARVARGH